MRARGPTGERALRWAASAAVVVASAALTAWAVVALVGGDGGIEGPTLSRAATLRAGPDATSAAVADADAGVAVLALERSADARWVHVRVRDRPGVHGWLPADALRDAGDLAALPPVAGAPTPTPSPTVAANVTATVTVPAGPDLPDLAAEALFSRRNRLVLLVANRGTADLEGSIYALVDGAEAVRIDVGGKPLRPGETLEAELPGEYVQRRATVVVELRPAPEVEESDIDNNRVQAVIAPDVDNDLELLSAELDGADGHLVVTVRNNSVIPLVGTVTVAVRETGPGALLLGRQVGPLEIDAGGTQRFDFAELIELDLASVQVILSTDAINDADAANNVLPRP